MDRPSRVPGTFGSIVGCDGGAVATGRVFVSTPSVGSAFRSLVEVAGLGGIEAGCGVADCGSTAFRSRGVYSVVSDGAGCAGAV